MIRGIHHISLKCGTPEEFAKAKEFYLGLLGLKIVREWPEGVMIGTGAGQIEIFSNGEGVRNKGAIRHVARAVDDVDAYADRVRAAGGNQDVFPSGENRLFLLRSVIHLPSPPPGFFMLIISIGYFSIREEKTQAFFHDFFYFLSSG